MDVQSLQPLHRQGSWQIRQQHVMPAEGIKDVLRDRALALPFHGILQQMLPHELPACFLEAQVPGGIVGGWQTAQIRRFGEGDAIDVGHFERSDRIASTGAVKGSN